MDLESKKRFDMVKSLPFEDPLFFSKLGGSFYIDKKGSHILLVAMNVAESRFRIKIRKTINYVWIYCFIHFFPQI